MGFKGAMKHLFVIFILLFFLNTNAQGNLQFNQVLLLNAASNNSTQWTVPVGKTWKIEAMGTYTSSMYVYLNNNVAFE